MSIELFLYKSGGEPDVFHYLVKKSLDAQRGIRCWQQEDEGRILFYFAEILRSQDCRSAFCSSAGKLQGQIDLDVRCLHRQAW